MNCPNCNREIPDDASFCTGCGHQLAAPQGPPPARPKLSGFAVASLVLSFLGFLILPALLGIVFGIVSLVQISKAKGKLRGQWLAITGIVIPVFLIPILAIMAAILFPVFAKARESARRETCVQNLHAIGSAISMYAQDYQGALPSSAIRTHSDEWNEKEFVGFASEWSAPGEGKPSWTGALSRYVSNKEVVWCPADAAESGPFLSDTGGTVSYYWKAAVDYAWFEGYTNLQDFAYPADQIVVYERAGWHWGDEKRGLSDGVTINCLFLDGHVTARRIVNSGYTQSDVKPGPLPPNGGEPAWFNSDLVNVTTSVGKFWNPEKYNDSLSSSYGYDNLQD
jgi:prepilin-type processing-associated H-X9-DG protein